MNQLPRLAKNFIVKPDFYPGHFFYRYPDFQHIIVKSRTQVFGIILQYRHHYSLFFQLAVGDSQASQRLYPTDFKITRIVAIVNEGHLIGIGIPHSELGSVFKHISWPAAGFRPPFRMPSQFLLPVYGVPHRWNPDE